MHDVHRDDPGDDSTTYPERVAIGAVRRDATPPGSPATCARDELHLAVDTQLAASRFDAEEVRAAIEDISLNAVGLGRGRGLGVACCRTTTCRGRPRARRRPPVGTCPGAGHGAGASSRCPARPTSTTATSLGLPDADLPDEARPRRRCGTAGEQAAATAAACRSRGKPTFRRTGSPPASPGSRSPTSTPCSARPSSSKTPAPRSRCTGAHWSCAVNTRASRRPRRPAPRWSGSAPRPAAWPSGGRGPRSCARSTPRPRRSRCPPGDPLLVSGPLDDGMLPPDTAVWLA